MKWYSFSPEKVLEKLNTSREGLTEQEAERRFLVNGPNQLPKAKPDSLFIIFLKQFQSPLIYILMFATAIVYLMGDTADALIILAVLFINAFIGTFQEGRAQNTLRALQDFVTTEATVVRDRDEKIISDEHLVVGDVILLSEGDQVPADARILESSSLKLDESSLTGESVPVMKSSDTLSPKEIIPGDQKNMVFRGTFVVGGSGYAVVVLTGVDTVIGQISKELSQIDTDIPLKKDIKSLSKLIIIVTSVAMFVIFLLGIYQNISVREMFKTVVAIAVSVIPEGLPVVVTLILAAGVSRMSKRKVLVRRLQAVEALGQANIIAVDKTGTLTLNQMMVEHLFSGGKLYSVLGNGYEPKGAISGEDGAIDLLSHTHILLAGKIAGFNSSANVAYSEEKKMWQKVYGDPTEAALLVFSQKVGFHKDVLLRESPLILDLPFDSNFRFRASINSVEGKPFLSVAGAPEALLPLCNKVLGHEGVKDMSDEERGALQYRVTKLSSQGFRVLMLAYDEKSPKTIDQSKMPKLVFAGLVAMSDTVRSEAKDAIDLAHSAGVRVVMITGDHMLTAKAIGEGLNIWKEGDEIISGEELASLSPEDLSKRLSKVSIFARITPQDKLKIIEAFRARGDIVAMTGDGVNDALSLAAADLGVSMGNIGTEVAKEASDIIITDDNFGSIVSGIEEGRGIYATIKKVVLYLLSTSIGELFTIVAAISLLLPVPLTASQIIWLNFVTDGFLVVALAMEPRISMLNNRINKKNKIIDRFMVERMFVQGITMMFGTVWLFSLYLSEGFAMASTVALTVLAIFQWFNVWNCRHGSEKNNERLPANWSLYVATLVVVILQLMAVYMPVFQSILKTVPLEIFDWVLILMVSLTIFVTDGVWRKIRSGAVSLGH